MAKKPTNEIAYPPGWHETTPEERERLAARGAIILEEEGTVPRGSLEAFAIAWSYAENLRRRKLGNDNADGDNGDELSDEEAGS